MPVLTPKNCSPICPVPWTNANLKRVSVSSWICWSCKACSLLFGCCAHCLYMVSPWLNPHWASGGYWSSGTVRVSLILLQNVDSSLNAQLIILYSNDYTRVISFRLRIKSQTRMITDDLSRLLTCWFVFCFIVFLLLDYSRFSGVQYWLYGGLQPEGRCWLM